jgi:hypothetical protein
VRSRLAVSVVALAAALPSGCGSLAVDELPPAAGPPASPPLRAAPAGELVREGPPRAVAAGRAAALPGGRIRAILATRARVLDLVDVRTGERLARASAGIGPTRVACVDTATCYVADTRGNGLLVFRIGDGGRALRLTRRYPLDGGPYGLALDRARRVLWVTLPGRNELVSLPAHARPHVISRRSTIRQPNRVAVDPRTGTVAVTGAAGADVQLVRP